MSIKENELIMKTSSSRKLKAQVASLGCQTFKEKVIPVIHKTDGMTSKLILGSPVLSPWYKSQKNKYKKIIELL